MGQSGDIQNETGKRRARKEGIRGYYNGAPYCLECYGTVGSIPDQVYYQDPEGARVKCADCGRTGRVTLRTASE